MKKRKKLIGIVMTAIISFSIAATGFAAPAAGGGGTITIKNTNSSDVSIIGNVYQAYKLFDVTYSTTTEETVDGYAYTVDSNYQAFFDTALNKKDGSHATNEEVIQYVNDQNTSAATMQTFAQAVGKYNRDNSVVPVKEVTATEETVIFTDMPTGYYLIYDEGKEGAQAVSACMLTTSAPGVTIDMKVDAPPIIKKIDKVNAEKQPTGNLVDTNNGAVGDIVYYQVDSIVPKMVGYKSYTFNVTDILSKGLTLNAESFVITVGTKTLTKEMDYTVTVTNSVNETGEYNNGTKFAITFKGFEKQTPGDKVVIKYQAVINEQAVIGVEGNPNKVKLEYSNNPNTDFENSTSETPWDETRTYVTEIEIAKVDNEGTLLTGAGFELKGIKLNKVITRGEVFTLDAGEGTYYKLKNHSYTTTKATAETTHLYESTTDLYKKDTVKIIDTTQVGVVARGFVGDDGKLKFSGLSEGTYTITELKAPDGYNLLKDPISVVIKWTEPETGGVIIPGTAAPCTWKFSATGGVNITEKEAENGIIRFNVVNIKGDLLPGTGGIGTTIFTVVGLLLMIGTATIFIIKRKRNQF